MLFAGTAWQRVVHRGQLAHQPSLAYTYSLNKEINPQWVYSISVCVCVCMCFVGVTWKAWKGMSENMCRVHIPSQASCSLYIVNVC